MRIVLYQPDIPQNCGAILRLGSCLQVPVDIVEPCGFQLDDRRLRRAGLDYLTSADYRRHENWKSYFAQRKGRLILLTTKAVQPYYHFPFQADDNLLFGRESAGVPGDIHQMADARLVIPLAADRRSINVAQAAAMVLGEALRQLGRFPERSGPA